MRSRLLLTFAPDLAGQPIIFQLVQRFGLELNILRASIDQNVEGRLLLEVVGSKDQILAGQRWLAERQVSVTEVGKLVTIDELACVHCGACTAVCSTEALKMNQTSWLLEYYNQHCVACAACVEACPLHCISMG